MATRRTRSQTAPAPAKKLRVVEEPPPVEEEEEDEDQEDQDDDDEEEEEQVEEEELSSGSELEEGGDDVGSGVSKPSGRGRGRGTGRGSSGTGDDDPTPGTSSGNKPGKKINVRSGVTMSIDEMVQNCLYYFLINQHKKIPVKRSDLIRVAMNGQKNNFSEVMAKFEKVLEDVFGMKIVGLEKGKSGGWASYIILSVFNFDVAENVTMRTHESDSRRAVLFILLCVMFMLNRSIDEEMVWKIMQDMNMHQLVCKKKEDLRKFLKSEYVTPMYLNLEEIKDTDHVIVRYSWGPRSEKEFSKYAILKFVAKQFPGKQSMDFTVQYNMVMETEKELVDADMEEHDGDGDNGSALDVDGETAALSTDSQEVVMSEGEEDVEEMETVGEDSGNESA